MYVICECYVPNRPMKVETIYVCLRIRNFAFCKMLKQTIPWGVAMCVLLLILLSLLPVAWQVLHTNCKRWLVFNQRNHNNGKEKKKQQHMYAHTELNAGIMAAKNNVCNMCVYVWETVCVCLCRYACCYCHFILDTQTLLINYHKSARGVNCDTHKHIRTYAMHIFHPHSRFQTRERKYTRTPFARLNLRRENQNRWLN